MWLVVTAVAAAENTLDLYWPDGHCEARVNNLFFFAALSLLQRDFAISGLSVCLYVTCWYYAVSKSEPTLASCAKNGLILIWYGIVGFNVPLDTI